ncbi:uncharacterized protein LOC111108711 isoform X2 [Crassostrea virginica]
MKSTFIGCVRWNYFFMFLAIFLTSCTSATDGNRCTGTCDKQFYDIQMKCKVYDENVTKYEIEYESTEDATLLCRVLVDLLLCVGRVAPVCLDQMLAVKASFFLSPYDCHLSDKDYSTIQRYRACQPMTTTTPVDSSSSPATHTFQISQGTQESKYHSSKSPNQTYNPNTKTHIDTLQTSKPINQLQQDSNSSNKLCFSRQMQQQLDQYDHQNFMLSINLWIKCMSHILKNLVKTILCIECVFLNILTMVFTTFQFYGFL